MSDLPTRDQLDIGMTVAVELKIDQGSGRLTEGIITKILTKANSHPHGIMVELKDGKIGRVHQIISESKNQNKIDQLHEIINDFHDKEEISEILRDYNLPSSFNKDKLIELILKNSTVFENTISTLIKELYKEDLQEISEQFGINSNQNVAILRKIVFDKILEIYQNEKPIQQLIKNNLDSSENNNHDTLVPEVEDEKNEFKSTFLYDLTEEVLRKQNKTEQADQRKNNYKQIRDDIQKEISIAICALANKNGGRLFIGVNDDSTVLGLGRDLKLVGNSIDEYTRKITDSLKNILKDNVFISQLDFQIAEESEKKYLVIFIPKSSTPIFVHNKDEQDAFVRIQKSSQKFSISDFMKYSKTRFTES